MSDLNDITILHQTNPDSDMLDGTSIEKSMRVHYLFGRDSNYNHRSGRVA